MLCKYANAFGKPREGVHKYRLYDIAVVDVALTVVAAFAVSGLVHTPLVPTIIAFFIAGIVAHYIFCVDTTIAKFLYTT